MKTFCIVLLDIFLQLNHALPSGPLHRSLEHPSSIINGRKAKIGDLPHQLALINNDDRWIFCGAALISPTQAFTAAHCIKKKNANKIQVVAGFIERFKTQNSQLAHVRRIMMEGYIDRLKTDYVQFAHVKKIVMHPKFNRKRSVSAYDFAILTFKHPLYMNKFVQPIAWNQNDSNTFSGENCVLSGWGQNFLYLSSKSLQKVETHIISDKQCKKIEHIYDTNICAYAVGFGACDGDSGGPMTCQHNGNPILAGVSSYVYVKDKKCDPKKPTVYSRVSNFTKFIQNNLEN